MIGPAILSTHHRAKCLRGGFVGDRLWRGLRLALKI
jgi:hypothetical protein